MAPIRSPIKCKKPILKSLKGVLYAHDAQRSTTALVPTVIHSSSDGLDNPRFPSFEAVLGVGTWTHECWVKVRDSQEKAHYFLVAAQYRSECEINASLQELLPESIWRGGLVVMRRGQYTSVVDIGGARFKKLATIAVRKFLDQAATDVDGLREVSESVPAVFPHEI